jgi:hypothetical protein
LIFQSIQGIKGDAAVAALSGFMGIDAEFVDFGDLSKEQRNGGPGRISAAVSGPTLVEILRHALLDRFKAFLDEHSCCLLVYGLNPDAVVAEALRFLTGGFIRDILPARPAGFHYQVGTDTKDICKQLSGLCIEGEKNNADHFFDMAEDEKKGRTLISMGGRPFFAEAFMGNYSIFPVASERVADVRDEIPGQLNIKHIFSALFPAAMFMKHVFKDACWHNDRSRGCLVVDDPLLKKNYGFLNYRKLLRLMDFLDFTTSIAFIPWNSKRTSAEVAAMFLQRPDRFSLCVHGCDHTQDEFGSLDYADMNSKVRTATKRMIEHKEVTGLAFDDVMVFPQGVFSTCSMDVLRNNRYLAALNAEALPVDSEQPLQIRCYLEPAITTYGKFPLFLRRFPNEIVELAMDLFWGRPALILAHHDFFREGYRQVAESISRLNEVDRDIEWGSVGEIIRRSHLLREEGNKVYVKGYVSRMTIENRSEEERLYQVNKEECATEAIRSVTAGGEKTSYDFSDGAVSLSVVLGPRETKTIGINYKIIPLPLHEEKRREGDLTILVRRYLSEMRDNYISKSTFLLSVATKLKNLLLS